MVKAGGEQNHFFADEGPDPTEGPIFQAIPYGIFEGPQMVSIIEAYNGSLDAAHALHKAVCNVPDVDIEYRLFGELCDVTIHDVGPNGYVSETSDTPARAWLLAILAALMAMEGR